MDSNFSFPPIDIGETKTGNLTGPQRKSSEQEQNRMIPFATRRLLVACRESSVHLFCSQVLGQ